MMEMINEGRYDKMYMGIVWLECIRESLKVKLETVFRPVVGDIVLINGKNYTISGIKWDLDENPEQCKITAYIE